MIKVFVDSGSSIKTSEKEEWGVEIVPLRFYVGNKEYSDGEDITFDEFYKFLMEDKLFPKTSLPNLAKVEEMVHEYTDKGIDVIFLTISSGISGTYNAIKSLFAGEEHVHVVDTKSAVGCMRILVKEIYKHKDEPIEDILNMVNELIPKLRIVAVPDTLAYLYRGGRLSRAESMIGDVLGIKPLIWFNQGKVTSLLKVRGQKRAMAAVNKILDDYECDENYDIIPSYTYDSTNLEKLLEGMPEKYKKQVTAFDNIDPVIACHWGPCAYGYMFVSKTTRAK